MENRNIISGKRQSNKQYIHWKKIVLVKQRNFTIINMQELFQLSYIPIYIRECQSVAIQPVTAA